MVIFILRLHDTTSCQTGCDNRLDVNRIDNRMDVCLHDPAGCPTACTNEHSRLHNRFDNRLNVCIHDITCCPTCCHAGLITGLTTGCTMYRTFKRLSNRFDNRFDNSLHRANEVLGLRSQVRAGTFTSTIWYDVPVRSRTVLPGRRRRFHTDDQKTSVLARSTTNRRQQ